MKAQEVSHLKRIEVMLPKERARPSLMLPLWDVAGFALGNHQLVQLHTLSLFFCSTS